MKFKKFFQWKLKIVFGLVVVVAGISWWFGIGRGLYQDYRDRKAFENTNAYELEQAQIAAAGEELPGLITILGNSQFKHWDRTYQVHPLSDDRIVSFGGDHAARIWKPNGAAQRVIECDSLRVAGDGTRLFVNQGNQFQVFDVATDELVKQFSLKEKLAYSYAKKWAVDQAGKRIAICTGKQVLIYNADRAEQTTSIPLDPFFPALPNTAQSVDSYFVALSRNGKRIAICSYRELRVYDVDSGTLKLELTIAGNHLGGAASITDIGFFGQNEEFVVICDVGGSIKCADLQGQTIELLNAGNDAPKPNSICFDWKNNRLLFHWHGQSYEVDMTDRGIRRLLHSLPLEGGNVRFVVDDLNRWLLIGSDNRIRIWEYGDKPYGGSTYTWDAHCIQFTPDGKFLVLGCNDGYLRFFRLGSWGKMKKKVHTKYGSVGLLSFSADHKLAAVGYGAGSYVSVQDRKSNDELVRNAIGPAIFDQTGRVLTVARGRQEICISRPGESGPQPKFKFDGTPVIISNQQGDSTASPFVGESLAMSRDRRWLMASSAYHVVSFWNYKTGAFEGHLGESPNNWGMRQHQFVLSPDGKLIATIGVHSPPRIYDFPSIKDGKLVLQKVKPKFELAGKFRPNERLVFSRDGQVIITAGENGLIRFWNAKDGKLYKTIKIGPKGSKILDLQFSNDERYFATANGNGTVYVFRTPDLASLKDAEPAQ